MPNTYPVKYLQQPDGTRLCGQTCVAMLAGVSLEKAIEVIGHGKGTKTREIAKALRTLGLNCPHDRLQRRGKVLPPVGIAKIPYPRGKNWHWVLLVGDRVFDPEKTQIQNRAVLDKEGYRATSILPVSLPLPA